MEGLDLETLELIQDTAVKASGAAGKLELVHPEQEPPHIYLAVKADGSFEKKEAGPKARNHRLITLDEVVRFATEKGSESSVIWYDRGGIVIVVDDETRRDFATLSLNLTPQMVLLQHLEKNKPGFDQKAFRKMLRIELGDCQRDPRLLNWVSDLKFANMSGAIGQFSNNRESLGTDIDAQAVSGAGECPDDVALDVRTFDDPQLPERQGIRCAFDFSPQEREFRLVPYPLEVHNAIELEVTFIGEKLRGSTDVPCFRGRFLNN